MFYYKSECILIVKISLNRVFGLVRPKEIQIAQTNKIITFLANLRAIAQNSIRQRNFPK
jgi:hypothetical protein